MRKGARAEMVLVDDSLIARLLSTFGCPETLEIYLFHGFQTERHLLVANHPEDICRLSLKVKIAKQRHSSRLIVINKFLLSVNNSNSRG